MGRFCGFLSSGNTVLGFGISYLARRARRGFLMVGIVGFLEGKTVLAGIMQINFPWVKIMPAFLGIISAWYQCNTAPDGTSTSDVSGRVSSV
eukprot:3822482-Heterocapsa_arctica.AAC.1